MHEQAAAHLLNSRNRRSYNAHCKATCTCRRWKSAEVSPHYIVCGCYTAEFLAIYWRPRWRHLVCSHRSLAGNSRHSSGAGRNPPASLELSTAACTSGSPIGRDRPIRWSQLKDWVRHTCCFFFMCSEQTEAAKCYAHVQWQCCVNSFNPSVLDTYLIRWVGTPINRRRQH